MVFAYTEAQLGIESTRNMQTLTHRSMQVRRQQARQGPFRAATLAWGKVPRFPSYFGTVHVLEKNEVYEQKMQIIQAFVLGEFFKGAPMWQRLRKVRPKLV